MKCPDCAGLSVPSRRPNTAFLPWTGGQVTSEGRADGMRDSMSVEAHVAPNAQHGTHADARSTHIAWPGRACQGSLAPRAPPPHDDYTGSSSCPKASLSCLPCRAKRCRRIVLCCAVGAKLNVLVLCTVCWTHTHSRQRLGAAATAATAAAIPARLSTEIQCAGWRGVREPFC